MTIRQNKIWTYQDTKKKTKIWGWVTNQIETTLCLLLFVCECVPCNIGSTYRSFMQTI